VSLDQLRRGQGTTFFRQHLTPDAGAMYYPVAMVLRMTPWLLAGAFLASVGVISRAVLGLRRAGATDTANNVAATLLLAVVPYAIVITLASQKYDRYSLPLFPFLAIACGVFLDWIIRRLGNRAHATRWILPVGVVLTVLLAVSTLSQAPYAISYVDPLAGGQTTARRTILLGWGEGLEVLGAEIRHREGRRCDDAQIAGPLFWFVAFPCGKFIPSPSTVAGMRNADYFVSYVSGRQRATQAQKTVERFVRRSGRLVKAVRVDGVPYAELWQLRPSAHAG
jgi:hypothetical protein